MVALLLVALSVGLDNFGASAAIGVSGVDRNLRFRVALVFGVCEAAMPVIGLLLGRSLAQYLGSAAKPLGGGLLIVAGTYAIGTELFGGDRERAQNTELSLKRLILIGIALSIDNLVIGFALGAYHVNIVAAAVIIGMISVALSLLGLEIGRRLGNRLGQRAELVGGVVLILVGLAIATGLL